MKSSLDARWTSIVKRCECVSDHPFKTSANLPDFLTPPVGSFLLLSVHKFDKFLTSPPLTNADVLNGWAKLLPFKNDLLSLVAPPNLCTFHRSCRGDGCIKNSKPLKPVKTSPGLLIKLYGNFLLQEGDHVDKKVLTLRLLEFDNYYRYHY